MDNQKETRERIKKALADEKAKRERRNQAIENRRNFFRFLGGYWKLISFILLFCIFFMYGAINNKDGSSLSIGATAQVYVDGLDSVFVTADEKTFDELNDALYAGDSYAISPLVLSGKVFAVDNNTKIKVLDIGLTKIKIRVLEGSNTGKAGWIVYEHVKAI